jgi:hypothetical protein
VPSFDLPLRRYFVVSGPSDSVSSIATPDGLGSRASRRTFQGD